MDELLLGTLQFRLRSREGVFISSGIPIYNETGENPMTDTVVENLILDLLEWLAKRDRTYEETMDAWRTSCPKLQVWEDANDRGLITFDGSEGRNIVRLTPSRARPPRAASPLVTRPNPHPLLAE